MENQSPIERFLAKHRISQAMVADAIGMTRSSINRKLAGDRPWKLGEVQAMRSYVAGVLERPVSFDELLGGEPVAVANDAA